MAGKDIFYVNDVVLV